MIKILVAILVLLGLLVLSKRLRKMTLRERKVFYFRLCMGLIIGLVFFLAFTGRLHFIAAVIAAVLPFAKRIVPLLRYVPLLRRLFRQVTSGMQMRSSLIDMNLDAESGDLNGVVKEGPYQGKQLSQLTIEQLLHIHKVATEAYPDAIKLLEAYLDRQHGHNWRQKRPESEAHESVSPADLELQEAYAILGIEASATKEEVILAHRKLMQKLHPDRGGSDFLAAQVNRAKEQILASIAKKS